jgi:proteasome assembly chaperone (PAC2) family protein
MPVVAGAAGLLIGTNATGDLLGVLLAAVVVGYLAAFIRAQRRLATAMSEWFGVKISAGQLPLMNVKRFDAWCERVQLIGQAKQSDGTQRLEPLRLKYDHKWGPIRWSSRAERDQH